MRLNEVIDNYGRKYSPYVKGLTNHLPMGQLALYKMCEDIDKVIAYSEMYIKKMDIDEVIVTGDIVTNIDECLSRTKLYGACVDFFKNEIKRDGPEKVIRDTLNNYPHGISSNLYHTIIRLGYAVEGYKIDNSSSDEIARSLSYYITAYKEVKPLKKKVKPELFFENAIDLYKNNELKNSVDRTAKFKNIFDKMITNPRFNELGKVIDSDEDTKIRTILNCIIDIYSKTNSFLVLHFITGLHGLITLKDYYEDFNRALDTYTTSCLAFLVTIEEVDLRTKDKEIKSMPWDSMISIANNSIDVHTIKFVHTCNELYKLYEIGELKDIAYKKIQ